MKVCPRCAAGCPDEAAQCQNCGTNLPDDGNASTPAARFGDLVLLETFTEATEAQIALGRLEASKIEAALITDDCGGMIPTLQTGRGIRLYVAPADLAAARDLLSTLPDAEVQPNEPDNGDPPR
jgi:hypothetical protein